MSWGSEDSAEPGDKRFGGGDGGDLGRHLPRCPFVRVVTLGTVERSLRVRACLGQAEGHCLSFLKQQIQR